MGLMRKDFATKAFTSASGSSYTFEFQLELAGYDNEYSSSIVYDTDNRYNKHSLSLNIFMKVKTSSGSYTTYKDTSGTLKFTVGTDVFTCSLGSLTWNWSSDGGYYWTRPWFGDTIYRAYTPGSSSRTSDSVKIEFITTDSTKVSGNVSGTLTYPTFLQASRPTTNYAVVADDQSNITIYTNRVNSSITHTLGYSIYRGGCYQIWDTTKTEYTTNSRDISGGPKQTIATGVGASYTWTLSGTYPFGYIGNNSPYDLVIWCESFYNGVSLGRCSVVVKMYKHTTASYLPYMRRLSIDDNNGMNYSRKHFVSGKSNVTFSGYSLLNARSGYSQAYFYDMRFKIEGGMYYDYDIRDMTSGSFTYNYTLRSTTTDYDVSWGNYRYKPGNKDLYAGPSGSYWYNGTQYGNTQQVQIDYSIWPYTSPVISAAEIYRVDGDDNRDSEGNFVHVRFTGTTCKIGGTDAGDNTAIFDINQCSLTMRYRTTSSSSWSTTTLVSTKYENYIYYDAIYKGNTFDPTLIYEFELNYSDKWETVSRSITIKPPTILIDYHKSGKSLSFGKVSEATDSQEIMETIFPLICCHTQNRTSSWTNTAIDAMGGVVQRGSNSGNYYHPFIGLSSTRYRRYSISTYDTDTSGSTEMRLYSYNTFIGIKQNEFRFQNSSGYYMYMSMSSSYVDFYTNASQYYFNNSPVYVGGNIYMGGNLVATQSWVTNQSYATQSWVNNKGYATQSTVNEKVTMGGDYDAAMNHGPTSSGTYAYSKKVYFGRDGTTYLQLCWGCTSLGTVPSSYSDQYVLRGTIQFPMSFSSSYSSAPLVIAVPCLNRNGSDHKQWKTSLSICQVSNSSFVAEVTAEGWQGGMYVNWFAIGRY